MSAAAGTCLRCLHLPAFAAGVQAILQDFPTQKWSVSNRKGLSFSSEAGEAACPDLPRLSPRHLDFIGRYSKEQVGLTPNSVCQFI